MQIALFYLNHLIEFYFTLVDSGQQLNRNGNLECARHWKSLRSIQRHSAPGFQMDCGDAGNSSGNGCHTRDLALELLKRCVKATALTACDGRLRSASGTQNKDHR